MRITEGIYENGQKFKLIDDWTKPSESHRLLEADWIGRTIFKVDLKEDVSLGGDYRRQRRRAYQSSAAPSIHTTVNTSKVSWADLQDSDERFSVSLARRYCELKEEHTKCQSECRVSRRALLCSSPDVVGALTDN